MSAGVLARKKMPYCPGCGRGIVTRNMSKALTTLGLGTLDVVVLSDIGCCGLIDGLFKCHTVHGLHGRAVALAMGVRFGMGADKKVIAVQGDGGATIGLQHLLEAARRNVDMTLIVQNNMVYGMTSGQLSGLSPHDFKGAGEEVVRPYDVCQLAATAGAAFVERTFVGQDTAELWTEALGTKGFSLVEIAEMCPAHGIQKVKDLESVAEYPAMSHREPRPPHQLERRDSSSLFDDLEAIRPQFVPNLTEPIGIILAGSAGEAVQSAGQLLAAAGMMAGLHATKKGEYPITVGTGFSVSEVILSPTPIRYTAIDHPNVVIAVSENGIRQVAARIDARTQLFVDDTLNDLPASKQCTAMPFRKKAGPKGAALAATAAWLRDGSVIPLDALLAAIHGHKRAEQLQAAIDGVLD